MPAEIELAGRMCAALILGGAIGLERELTGQAAGLRTHMMVALGSAVFAIVSAYGFEEFAGLRADTNVNVDVSRVASNIVTGVGFLGGGAILKDGASVRGLTTAASLWVTAAVGLAVGLGGYFTAAVATLALVFSLTALRAPRLWLRRNYAVPQEAVSVRLRSKAAPEPVIAALRSLPGLEVKSLSLHNGGEEMVLQAALKGPDLELRLAELAERDDVLDVDVSR